MKREVGKGVGEEEREREGRRREGMAVPVSPPKGGGLSVGALGGEGVELRGV